MPGDIQQNKKKIKEHLIGINYLTCSIGNGCTDNFTAVQAMGGTGDSGVICTDSHFYFIQDCFIINTIFD